MNYRDLVLRLRDAARDDYIEAGISASRWAESLRDEAALLEDAADAIEQLRTELFAYLDQVRAQRLAEYDPTKPLPPGYQ